MVGWMGLTGGVEEVCRGGKAADDCTYMSALMALTRSSSFSR